jgi:hypothetical protein
VALTYRDLQEILPDMRICSLTGGETHLILMSQEQYDGMTQEGYGKLCDALDRYGLKVVMLVCKNPATAFRCFKLEGS